jgi:hypothetical protein
LRKEIEEATRRERIADYQGIKQYGKSKFRSGQRVTCSIPGLTFSGQIGIVKRAINSKFVEVQFDSGITTIQSDNRFTPIDTDEDLKSDRAQ